MVLRFLLCPALDLAMCDLRRDDFLARLLVALEFLVGFEYSPCVRIKGLHLIVSDSAGS